MLSFLVKANGGRMMGADHVADRLSEIDGCE